MGTGVNLQAAAANRILVLASTGERHEGRGLQSREELGVFLILAILSQVARFIVERDGILQDVGIHTNNLSQFLYRIRFS